MAFQSVIELVVGGRKARVYLQTRTATFEPRGIDDLRKHLDKVFMTNGEALDHGKKYVLIVWGEKGVPMIDWWVWGEDESEEEGAMIEVYLFRDKERYESPVVTAEDGLRVLAEEIDN